MKRAKRFWYWIRYRLIFDIRYGEGYWGVFYCKIASRFNPMRPFYWKRNQPPAVDLPDGYIEIVPLAHHTGDGWWLHWGTLYDGDDSDIYDRLFPEPLCDVTDISDRNDYTIEEWPFILPCASSDDLKKAGFYEV